MDVNVDVLGETVVCEILNKKNVQALKPIKSNVERHYSFDTNQFNAIFDWFLANKRVKLKEKHI